MFGDGGLRPSFHPARLPHLSPPVVGHPRDPDALQLGRAVLPSRHRASQPRAAPLGTSTTPGNPRVPRRYTPPATNAWARQGDDFFICLPADLLAVLRQPLIVPRKDAPFGILRTTTLRRSVESVSRLIKSSSWSRSSARVMAGFETFNAAAKPRTGCSVLCSR